MLDIEKAIDSLQRVGQRQTGAIAVNVRIPGDVIDLLDELANQEEKSRSDIVRIALIEYLASRQTVSVP